MKYSKIVELIFTLSSVFAVEAQSFCSNAKHSGESVKVTSNKVGSIGDIGYELWADSGNNSATFYSDGSLSCSFQNAKDYLCRSGLSFDSTKTHDQIGHMYADFKLVKQNIQNVDYSYVGVYGWSRDPLVEYYVVDNWLSQWRPGDWVGNKKHGDFTIDGAQYTVYENTRYGPSIDGDTQFKQFFSIRQQARDCGTIDITAHFQQWEKLGMKLGKMHEAKVLGEAGSTGSGTTGTADFPYAKVYIEGANNNSNTNTGNNNNNTGSCSAKITSQGYKCCSSSCVPSYTDGDGDWAIENGEWCGCGNGSAQQPSTGSCSANILAQGYKCCSAGCQVIYTDNDGTWGAENGEWCGCGASSSATQQPSTGSCSANILAQGYKCCSAGCQVIYTDNDGTWGAENGEWCGCGSSTNTNTNTGNNNQSTTTTTYPKGTGFQFYTQCKNRNHWALTYDDGPTQYADSILDLLKKYDIKATFFLVGNMYIKSYDSEWTRIVKRMYNEGHVVASHTYSHDDLTTLSSQQITADMQKLEDAVYKAVGVKPAFMRPPYGSGNGNQNVMNTLKNFGINAACNWHVDPMDWDNGGNINYAKQVLGKLNGEGVITLNHLQYNGATAQGILDLSKAEIELMLSKGYKPVTMEECLGMSAYK